MARTQQERFLKKQRQEREAQKKAQKKPPKQEAPVVNPVARSRKPTTPVAQLLSPPPPLESTPVVKTVPPGTMEPSDALFPRDYGGEEVMGDYKRSTAPKRGEAPSTEVKSPPSLVTSAPMQSATKDDPSSTTYFPPLPEGPSLPVEAPKKLAKIPKSKRGLTPDQPSSVTADDYSRMTGRFEYKPTGSDDIPAADFAVAGIDPKSAFAGQIFKGPAETEVVGGTGKGYDKWATPQERQERADQFLKDYPAVDVTGKSREQVQSEMADAAERYLENVEGKKGTPKREFKFKRPLSERAPEYRDTKRGREYWEAAPEGLYGDKLKENYSFDSQQGGWGKWKSDPIKDLNYPDERIRDLSDKRSDEEKTAQREVAREIREGLSKGVDYWDKIENRSKYEELVAKAATEGNISPLLFNSFMKREKNRIIIPRDRARMLERQRAIVENPANWAMKGLQDPSDIAKTRKRAYPDQTAEQQAIIAEERRKAAEEAVEKYKKQKEKDKD